MAMDDRLRKFTKDLEMLKFAEPTQYDIKGAPVYKTPKVVTGNPVKRPNIFNPKDTFFDIANKKIGVGVTSGDIYDDSVAAEAARVANLTLLKLLLLLIKILNLINQILLQIIRLMLLTLEMVI